MRLLTAFFLGLMLLRVFFFGIKVLGKHGKATSFAGISRFSASFINKILSDQGCNITVFFLTGRI